MGDTMLKVAICDDNIDILPELSARIEESFSNRNIRVSVHSFSNVVQLKQEAVSFDVFFLDIDMPEMDGVDFGAFLRKHNNEACIVFVSSREERVYDALRVTPLRFIRKSCFNEEIDEAVMAIKVWWETRRNRLLVVPSHGHLTTVPIDDILYVECLNKKQCVVTKEQAISFRGTMNDLEEKLLCQGFIRPHIGYMVNYRYIDSISSSKILLHNGVSIPVSKHKAKEIKQLFIQLVSKEPNPWSPYTYEP
jgi:DNA-binding LytR/AlgR family response regulator